MLNSLRDFDRRTWSVLTILAERPLFACLGLVGLVALCVLPGLFVLPPVDRTEVRFALWSRDLLEAGPWLQGFWDGAEQPRKPIATYWLQMISATLMGPDWSNEIASYRLPSFVMTAFGVVLIYILAAPILGRLVALISAIFMGITTIVVMQAHFSIAEPVTLPFLIAAQLALMRLYVSDGTTSEADRSAAIFFWLSLAISVLFNALAVVLIVLATLIALALFDRKVTWLKRLRFEFGVPILGVGVGLWLYVRSVADSGTLFQDHAWTQILSAVMGAQRMNFSQPYGIYTLFLLFTFMPAHLLFVSGVQNIKALFAKPATRFLLAWLGGSLVYLELFSAKPALYTVQFLFPAAAMLCAVSLLHVKGEKAGNFLLSGYMALLTGIVAALIMPLIVGLLVFATGANVDALILFLAVMVAILFVAAVYAAAQKFPGAWFAFGCLAVVVLNFTAFTVLFPQLEGFWFSKEARAAMAPLESCPRDRIHVVGFYEPSLMLELGAAGRLSRAEVAAGDVANRTQSLAIVEEKSLAAFDEILEKTGQKRPPQVGCFSGFNFTRGCSASFKIFAMGLAKDDQACLSQARSTCSSSLDRQKRITLWESCPEPKMKRYQY